MEDNQEMKEKTEVIPEEQELAELVEDMLRQADTAEEPGSSREERIVHRGDNEVPAPMVISTMESAGWVYIYDTRTGERSITNRNMLPTQLQKVRPDGSRVFTTVKPKVTPKRGTLKCLLHPDSPDRARFDEMGLPVCMKSNLTSPYHVRRHMEKRHQAEWAILEQEQRDKERDEDRNFRKLILGTVAKQSTAKEYICEECGAVFDHHLALAGHKKTHKNK